ncbi:MAG: hypothetical protein J7J86_03460 [Bacteroidales bacterium]|nr:hypothetical protein [Bacteroidales bacterium]
MINKNNLNQNFNSLKLLLFLYKWRKILFIVSLVSILTSIIFSSPYFITPKYKSTVIMYPVSTNSISKALLNENVNSKEDILGFGEDEQTEQMLQILNSNKIRNRVIRKFDLMKHYKIDTTLKYKYTKLYKEYKNNIKFNRTKYMAVEITVYDKDPQMAANIANYIAESLDYVKNQIQKERALKGFKIVEAEYNKLKTEIQVKEDSLTTLRKLGVHDYESQVEMINRQMAMELAKGNKPGISRLEAKLKILAKYGGPYVSLRDALEHDKKQLSAVKNKYEEAKIDAENFLPQKFIVNSAFKAERKSYPIRWIIILISFLSSIFITIIVLIIIEDISLFNITKNVKTSLKPDNILKSDKNEIIFNNSQKNINSENNNKIDNDIGNNINNIKKNNNTENNTNNNNTEKNSVKSNINNTEKKINLNTSNNNNKMDNLFNSSNLIKVIFKWKKHIIITLAVSLVLAAIFSSPFFIKPKFKSIAIIYPSNISPYSDENETEQMLQWLNSRDIKDSIINKYHLDKHYKIDKNYKHYYSSILYKYSKNIIIKKTQYESVEIEVLDTDPLIAYNIVNSIIDFYNLKIRRIHREKSKEVLDVLRKTLEMKKNEINSVEKNLYTLRTKYGIIDYGNQSREVARGFLGTVDGNNVAQINKREVLKLKKNIEIKGGEFIVNNTRLYDLLREYSVIQNQYDLAYKDVNKEFTYTNIVTPPYVADKKCSPNRFIILALTALAVLFFTIITIFIIENKKKIIED